MNPGMITRKLAAFVTETPTSKVPVAAMAAARDGLVDTIGCAIAGTREPVSEIASDWVGETGAGGRATVWGRAFASGPADAAFANAVSAHALDFDDSHPSVRGHASASLVPTAVAVGEAAGADGREVLAAYAIGIEVAGKIGRAFGHGLVRGGWHPTAIAGALAATAVAARLSGQDAATLQRAWGVAGSEIGGLVRNFGTMTKPFHAGCAARSGVTAARLAGAGMTADTGIFDGSDGVFDVYGAEGESPEDLVADLGTVWEIVAPGNYVKRWPCCYSNHRPIGALLRLIEEHDITAGEVEEVVVSFLPSGDSALVSRAPTTGLAGKFSIEYVVAALLLDQALTLATFTDEAVTRPEAQALLAKVQRKIIPDRQHYTGLVGYNDVIVTTGRGRFRAREDRTPGSPAWPATDADRTAKFADCAVPVLGDEGAGTLFRLARNCLEVEEIGEVAAATSPHDIATKPQRASG
jgi:2-methylcitrate dehydratase PrpD